MKAPRATSSWTPWRRAPRDWAAVCFSQTGLEVSVARAGAGAREAVRETAIASSAAPPAGGVAAPGWAEAARSLREQLDPGTHRVIAAIGSEDVLCRVLRLPSAQPGEVRQMLDLQIDRLTPLPLEEVVYDFEPLAADGGQTRVLVAIARKEAVNQRVEALETAGLPAEAVEVDTLAVFRGLVRQRQLPDDENLNALVLLEPACANVVTYAGGQPLGLRSVVFAADGLSGAEGRAALAEELQWTLMAEQAEEPARRPGCVIFGAATEALRPAAAALAGAWPAHGRLLDSGAVPLPATSLCLDQAAGEGRRLNLLPEEWRQRRRAAWRRRALVRGAIALGVAYAVGLAGWLTAVGVRRAQVGRLRSEVQELEPQFRAARGLHSELVAMENQLDTKYSALEVLREVSLLMPENLKFSTFEFRKDESVTLRGEADSAQSANDFIGRLEHCPLFSTVKTVTVRTENAAGLTRFEVLATLKSAGARVGSASWH